MNISQIEDDAKQVEAAPSAEPEKTVEVEESIHPLVLNPGQPITLFGHRFKIANKGPNFLMLVLVNAPKPREPRRKRPNRRRRRK